MLGVNNMIGVVVSNDGHFLLDNKYSETIKSLKDCNDLFHLTDEYKFEDKKIRFVLHELLSKMNIPFWEKAQEQVKQKIENEHPKLKEKGFKYATELPCITPSEILQCWTGDRNQLKLASQIYASVLGAESSENQNVQICTRESIELLEHLCKDQELSQILDEALANEKLELNDKQVSAQIINASSGDARRLINIVKKIALDKLAVLDAQSVGELLKNERSNNKLVLEKGFTAGLDKLINLPEEKFKLTTLECENIIEAIVVLRKYEIYWFWYELNSNNPPLMDNLESAFAKVNITLSIKDVIAIQEMKFALDQFNVEFLQKHLISYVDTYLYKSLSIRASQRKALQELQKEMRKAKRQKAEELGYDFNNLIQAEEGRVEKEVETEIKRLKYGYDEEMATMFCDDILVFKTKKTMENNVDTIHAYSSILWVFTRIKNKEVFERVHKEAKNLLDEFTEVLRNIPIDDIPANELWHYHNTFANYYERLVEFGIKIEKNTEKALESYLYARKVNGADRKWISGSFSNIADFLYCYVYIKKDEELSAECCQLLVNLAGEDGTDVKTIIEKYSLKSIKMKLEIFDKSDVAFPAYIYSKVAK
jgi:hypothetical protein